MNLDKAIQLNTESEQSLRNHKFPDYADAILLGNEALKCIKVLRLIPDKRLNLTLPGDDSIEDTELSNDRIHRVRESPLGKEPKPALKVNQVPETTFTYKTARLTAITLYKQLTNHKDRKPRYTLLTFCGATPQQAYKWRDWSTKRFQLIFDYLFNPEPLAEGLVNNRLGLTEEGLKSVAVA